jgi:micrococcal nuclease
LHRARFHPRRPIRTGLVLAVAALVAFRVWQLSSNSAPDNLEEGEYLIAGVIDGDTLRLDNGAFVRLIGVDAPETHFSRRSGGVDQPFAVEARSFVERYASKKRVRLQFDKERVDQYGRFLAYVWYDGPKRGEKLLLNEELVRWGLARARLKYPFSDRIKRRLRSAENEARRAKRGIWSLELRPAENVESTSMQTGTPPIAVCILGALKPPLPIDANERVFSRRADW